MSLHNGIFYSIHLVLFTTLPILLYHLPCIIKKNKLWDEKKRFFVYMTTLTYHIISKEVENCIFRHTCICKQPILTKYWNYYSFVFTVGSLYLELARDQQICSRYRKLPQKSKYLLIKQERLTKVY